MSEEETISAPFGEAEMSLLVLLDEVPPNGFEIDHKAEADVLQALARRFNVEEVADLHFQALLVLLDKQCLQANGTVRGRVRQICGRDA